ncbi:hypothetical protein OC844_008094, partial [Tilletia horrida]
MYALIKHRRSSALMWSDLHKLNNLKTPEHRAAINQKVCNLFLEDIDKMTLHLEVFVEIAAEAEAAGLSWGSDEVEKAYTFLDTLPHSLRTVRSDWRALPESDRHFFSLISLYNEEATALQRSAERVAEATAMAAFQARQKDSSQSEHKGYKIKGAAHQGGSKKVHHHPKNSQGSGFNKKGNNNSNNSGANAKNGDGTCYGCGKTGHIREECPVAKHLGPGGIICWKCHKKGHTSNECPGHHAKAVFTEDEGILGALIEEHALLAGDNSPSTIAFMIDSGASQHIVEHEWMLSNSRVVPEIAFKTVGSKLKANKSGDIK